MEEFYNLLKVAAVTITYNPDVSILRRQLVSLNSLGLVVIVDNGSRADLEIVLKQLVDEFDNTYFIALNTNRGIAIAQNTGAAFATKKQSNIEYLLFLDHDSMPSEEAVNKLLSGTQKAEQLYGNVGACGPRLIDPRSQRDYGFHKFSRFGIKKLYAKDLTGTLVQCDQINSSGSLIPVKSWEEVGPFNQDFFIDHVETDWCFRAEYYGLNLFGVLDSVFFHEMGDDNYEFWFFGKRTTPVRSPQRHYYIVRNSMYLQKQRYTPIRWKLLNVLKLLFTFIFFGFFTPEKKQHRNAIYRGLLDGISGKMGMQMP